MNGNPEISWLLAHRRDFTVQPDGLLCPYDQLVIPLSLVKSILDELHKCHLGAEEMKLFTRRMFLWPDVNENICTMPWTSSSFLYRRLKSMTRRLHSVASYPRGLMQSTMKTITNIRDVFDKYAECIICDLGGRETLLPRRGSAGVRHRQYIAVLRSRVGSLTWPNWMSTTFTALRHWCSDGGAKNLVLSVKSIFNSANPRTNVFGFWDFHGRFPSALLHTPTKLRPVLLFKSRQLRCCLKNLD